MKHDITFEQLESLGFVGVREDFTKEKFEKGASMAFRCGTAVDVFVCIDEVMVGNDWEASSFKGVENEHDLKTLIMLLYGDERKASTDGSGN